LSPHQGVDSAYHPGLRTPPVAVHPRPAWIRNSPFP
jgi:hypothetical protein